MVVALLRLILIKFALILYLTDSLTKKMWSICARFSGKKACGLVAVLATANISAYTLHTHRELEVLTIARALWLILSCGWPRHLIAFYLIVDDISEELRTSLIEEYTNKKPPSNSKIYHKIH
ncbi:hypothetical protein DPV78_011703 [Talaromyces pinophilus]|nr:hypothetical protein DPV78_011703 [Talaromyces pinophilus]